VLGYDAIETGVAFLQVSLGIGVLSLAFSPQLNMRFGAKATLIPGLVLIIAGLAYFSRAPVDGEFVVDVLPSMLLLGVGAGLSFPSLMTLGMSGATRTDSGLASGLVNTSLQVGGALGLAVLATLSSTRSDNLLADGEDRLSALTGGYHLAFAIGAGLVGLALVAATFVLQSEAELEEAEQPNAELASEAA
jgi:fucose permease